MLFIYHNIQSVQIKAWMLMYSHKTKRTFGKRSLYKDVVVKISLDSEGCLEGLKKKPELIDEISL